MICSTPTQRKKCRGAVTAMTWTFTLALICAMFGAGSTPAFAQTGATILTSDFEDGTAQGWISRGTAVLTPTMEAAHGGAWSLKVTGRTASWNGPSIDLTGKVVKGTLYQVTAWVRLVSGQPADTVKITMQRTLGPGSACQSFDTVATSAANGVTDGGWVMLSGQYIFSSEASNMLLYLESNSATTSFYVDDVTISQIARDDSGITAGFESNTPEGFGPRGAVTLTPTSADAHSGSFSLLTTGRTAAFQGPSIDVTNKMYNGSQYNVSVWVKMAPGTPDTVMRVSMQINSQGNPSFFTVIGNATVTAGAWKQFTGNFTVPAGGDSSSLYVETNSDPTASFYIDDFQVTFLPPPVIQALTPLHTFFEGKIPLGGAVVQQDIVGPKSDLLKLHFNSITPGNDMKWDAIEGTENTFTFGNADKLVCYAEAFGMGIRGHTLVWHNQVPNWVFLDANGVDMSTEPPSDANKQLLLNRLRNHIANLVGRYAGKIYAWDVVNEVIDESQPDGFRRSKWFLIAGKDFIDVAFQAAHQADPNAKLYINDFNTTIPAKRAFLLQLVTDLKARGIPVDGVGHQFHNNVDFPINDNPASQQQVIDTINAFADLGLANQVTEFDTSIYSGPNPTIYTNYADIPTDLHVKVGYRYRDYFQIYKKLVDEGKLTSVTIWGEADDDTWLTSPSRVDAPLPFDNRMQASPAYYGIIDPLQLPGADLAADIKAFPTFDVTGRTVLYRINTTNNGNDPAASVVLTDTLPAGILFQSLRSPAGWTCTTPAPGATGQISCTIPSMDKGATGQFLVVARVDCSVPNKTQIANSVTISSSTRDPNPAPNNTASATVTVFNPPPVIFGLSVDRPVLVENGRMVPERLFYRAADNCGRDLSPTVTVSSNQPSGSSPDWTVIDPHNLLLRAVAIGGDRVYTITVTATDPAGASTSKSVNVRVLNRGR